MYDTALLVLRLVVGLYIAAHGAQKLFGWFGGSGLQATIDGFEGRRVPKGGYELPATNLAVALAVALLGVGRFSADAVLGLSVPQSVDLVFGILVLLGVVAAAFSRGPRQQPSGGVVS